MPLIAIPDIHGDLQQLDAVLQAAEQAYANPYFVFLGDYVDRGPDSAGVLRLVREVTRKVSIALIGNHEDLLLGYLALEEDKSFDFAVAGGGETIESFASEAGHSFATPGELADYLESEDLLHWLKSLPYRHRVDRLSFTHAPVPAHMWTDGGNPPRDICLWNKPPGKGNLGVLGEGLGAPDNHFAVCGHVIMGYGVDGIRRPARFAHGVYLDCGCGSKDDGRLVAGVFEDGELLEYLTAEGREALA